MFFIIEMLYWLFPQSFIFFLYWVFVGLSFARSEMRNFLINLWSHFYMLMLHTWVHYYWSARESNCVFHFLVKCYILKYVIDCSPIQHFVGYRISKSAENANGFFLKDFRASLNVANYKFISIFLTIYLDVVCPQCVS